MNTYKSDSPYLDGIIKNYINGAKQFYPNFEFSSSWTISSGDEPRSCELELSFCADIVKGTEYEIREKIDLIHYTANIQNVIEILNSGYLRLSNLIPLNDPQEISFMIKNLDVKEFEGNIIDFKSTFFTASFCEIVETEKPDDFPMWRTYGNDGLGVSIVFEVTNFNNNWNNFILSKVQYGHEAESVRRFNDYMRFHNLFQENNNHPIQNILISPTSFTALHKNKIWEFEKEIRLLSHNEYDEYTLKNTSEHICKLKHSLSKNNVKYSYIELPLYGGNEYKRIVSRGFVDALNRLVPILKVKEIILGYRIDKVFYSDITSIINYLSTQYDYQILIKESHLKEFMI